MKPNTYRAVGLKYNGLLSTFILTALSACMTAFAQPKVFTENRLLYNNGRPKEVTLKNEDLEVIGYRVLNPVGTILYQLMANPEKGIIDVTKGPVKAVIGKGLTCAACEWTPQAPDSESNYVEFITSFNGKFHEGRPVGPVRVFRVSEPYRSSSAPSAEAWVDELSPGLRMQMSSFLAPSRYTRELKMTLNYNQKGNLEGAQKINPLTSLFFKDGVLMGFMVRNESNPSIVKDSVFREAKIWKINNQYQRNTAFLKTLEWNEFDAPWELKFEPVEFSNTYDYPNSESDYVFFGSGVSQFNQAFSQAEINLGFVYGGNWKDQNYIQFKLYSEGTKGHFRYEGTGKRFSYKLRFYHDEQYDNDEELKPLIKLFLHLTQSSADRAFPQPTSDFDSPYSFVVNEALKDLGYYEYSRKKRAGVNVSGEYPALLISLFDKVCAESPLAYDPECSNGVYIWDFITWMHELLDSGLFPLRGLYLITDEGEFINYATPANAKKFVELANSRR